MAKPPLYAVLDTNNLISAVLKPHSQPAAIVSAAVARIFTLCMSEAILQEYREVLTRGKFALPPDFVDQFLTDLKKSARIYSPKVKFSVTRDPTDNKFLECAYEAGAPYLVTGNMRHYPRRFRGIHILAPREFFRILLGRLTP